MDNWTEGTGTISSPYKSRGRVKFCCWQELADIVRGVDGANNRGEKSSVVRKDGVLVNIYRSNRTGRVVIERVGGNWVAFSDIEYESFRTSAIEKLEHHFKN